MRKIILFFVALTLSCSAMAQQKYCYIYSQKIFQSMPEYNEAIKKVETKSSEARKRADDLLAEVKTIFDEFQQYQSKMTKQQSDTYRKMIINREKEANAYEEKMFGPEGEIAKMQKEIMEPIERKVMAVIEAYAKKGNYDMIFDLSIAKVTVFQSLKLDVTEAIIADVKNYNYQ